MGKSLGKDAGGPSLGEQLILSGTKTFVHTGLCVVWNSGQRVGGRAEETQLVSPPSPTHIL